jgi:hypothetical protein
VVEPITAISSSGGQFLVSYLQLFNGQILVTWNTTPYSKCKRPILRWHTYLFLVTVAGWYHAKRAMQCGHFLICCASTSEFSSFLIHPPELSGKHQQRNLVAKQGETWREISVNFDD